MNKDQIGRVLSSGFLPSQVGALARYVEPISVWEPLDTVRASLAADPSVQCIPVEAEQGLYRILERRRVAHHPRSALSRFSGGGSIKPLLSSSFGVIDARQSVEHALNEILSAQREPYQHHLVFHRGRYFGVVQLSQLVRHAFGMREDELARARSIQQHLVHLGDWNPPDYSVEILLDMAYELGGDFYHRQPLSADRDLVVCFDVSGKNISAALSTSLISSFFSTLEIAHGFDDMGFGDIIGTLNTVLCRQTPPELFVAALFMFFDRRDDTLSVFNLGYSPLMVIEDGVESIPPDYPPLGIDEELHDDLQARRIPRRPGLRLFSASDGLADAQNRYGEPYGDEGVLSVVTRNATGTTGPQFLEELHQDVRTFIGDASRTDDITMIVLDF